MTHADYGDYSRDSVTGCSSRAALSDSGGAPMGQGQPDWRAPIPRAIFSTPKKVNAIMKLLRTELICLSAALLSTVSEASIIQVFNFTGASQNFVVPSGVSIVTIEAWGAQGWSGSNQGGLGGYAIGNLPVTAGELLGIYVGGQGTAANVAFTPMGGGFNGGGNGQTYFSSPAAAVGGGGGASDVRQLGLSLLNRVIVAGGGGGSANRDGPFGGTGGAGGGAAGGSAPGSGTGGTQSVGGSLGGSFGQGGSATSEMSFYNGGGGGGWYGGGVSPGQAGGGGGSSFIPTGLSNGTIGGMRRGDGLVRITYEDSSVAAAPEPLSLLVWGGLAVASAVIARRTRRCISERNLDQLST